MCQTDIFFQDKWAHVNWRLKVTLQWLATCTVMHLANAFIQGDLYWRNFVYSVFIFFYRLSVSIKCKWHCNYIDMDIKNNRAKSICLMPSSHCTILARFFKTDRFWEIADKCPTSDANRCSFTIVPRQSCRDNRAVWIIKDAIWGHRWCVATPAQYLAC